MSDIAVFVSILEAEAREIDAATETPKQRRVRQQAERQMKAEAKLQETLELVTAMFWSLERDNLTDAQVAACSHDRVLAVLWARIWDYAEFVNRTQIGRAHV